MSDENFSGSIGVGTHVRFGTGSGEVFLDANSTTLQTYRMVNGTRAIIGTLAPGAPARILPPRGPRTMMTHPSDLAGYTVAGATSSNLADTTDFVLADRSASVVTPGNSGTDVNVSITGITAIDLTGKSLLLWIKLDNAQLVSRVKILLGSSSGFATDYFPFTAQNGTNAATEPESMLQSGVWTPLVISFQEYTVAGAVGSPLRNAINSIRFQFRDTGTPTTIRIGGLAAVPEAGTTFPNGVVTFTFDDVYPEAYSQGRLMLDKYGYQATCFPICDVVDTTGFISLAQLQSLQANSGWEVGFHSYSVADHAAGLNTLSASALESNIQMGQQWLRSNGFLRGDLIAYPSGNYNQTMLTTVRKYFTAGRGVVSPTRETFPPSDPFVLRSRPLDNQGSLDLAAAEALIDLAVTYKSWVILTCHKLVTTPSANSPLEYPIASFASLVDYIATKGCAVRTLGDVLRTTSVN